MQDGRAVLGVIGGSGLYEIPEMEGVSETSIKTPFGTPSGPVIEGRIDGRTVFFLPRHGKGHVLSPTEVPYRANVWALKSVGVTHLLSVSAVGSLQEEIVPGHLVVPDQLIDRTKGIRPSTFFEGGAVAHVPLGEPYCSEFRQALLAAAGHAEATVHDGGTLVCMEGPQFSTRAESFLYRSWGAQLIGMTALPEAKLAREASLCYATLALATDYDCWHDGHDSVTVEAVIEVMKGNALKARKALLALVRSFGARECGCAETLKFAVVTSPNAMSEEVKARLALLLGK
jgi:5'-methylthioadenosine phosphorylase